MIIFHGVDQFLVEIQGEELVKTEKWISFVSKERKIIRRNSVSKLNVNLRKKNLICKKIKFLKIRENIYKIKLRKRMKKKYA
jgi:hypothetical protein